MIVLINGPINTGKTTVGRLLASVLPRTAHVEVDALREFIASVPLAEAMPINLENAACVTANLVRRGFNVVLTYPLGDDDHAYLLDQFAPLDAPIHTFTLGPSLEVALRDRGGRRLTPHERHRIRQQYAAGRHTPPFGVRVDTGTLSPQETVAVIASHLRGDIPPAPE